MSCCFVLSGRLSVVAVIVCLKPLAACLPVSDFLFIHLAISLTPRHQIPRLSLLSGSVCRSVITSVLFSALLSVFPPVAPSVIPYVARLLSRLPVLGFPFTVSYALLSVFPSAFPSPFPSNQTSVCV